MSSGNLPARRALSVLIFVALAYGGPLVRRNPECNVGAMHCCQSVQSSNSSLANTLADLLDVILQPNTQVGIACSPLVGAGSGPGCTAVPVCCNGASYHGLINVGCDPAVL